MTIPAQNEVAYRITHKQQVACLNLSFSVVCSGTYSPSDLVFLSSSWAILSNYDALSDFSEGTEHANETISPLVTLDVDSGRLDRASIRGFPSTINFKYGVNRNNCIDTLRVLVHPFPVVLGLLPWTIKRVFWVW